MFGFSGSIFFLSSIETLCWITKINHSLVVPKEQIRIINTSPNYAESILR